MRAFAENLTLDLGPNGIKVAFLKWQCRVRQIAMRENSGRPDESIMPLLFLDLSEEPVGSVITLIHKLPKYSLTAELFHMAKKTFDPAQRRDQAIQLLSSNYYQKFNEFSDVLTATFLPNSEAAKRIHESKACFLIFEAFSQRFELSCKVWKLAETNYFYQATVAHNQLFNPSMHPDTIILCFEPDWSKSFSTNS